jgi:gamma-glutamyltranspeptidase/glutathione hydrolase
VFGSMGGDAQAQVHAQLLAHIVDDRADVQVALDAPRWQVDPVRWHLLAESGFGDDVLRGLEARGHEVDRTKALDSRMGHAHAIAPGPDGYAVGTDPRAEGAALGL